jgi:threonyl-tRNA synthetase
MEDEEVFLLLKKEVLDMSVEVELEESVNYTPIQRMRHSASHVMAEAIQEIFPDAKFAIGPAIEDGFITISACHAH